MEDGARLARCRRLAGMAEAAATTRQKGPILPEPAPIPPDRLDGEPLRQPKASEARLDEFMVTRFR